MDQPPRDPHLLYSLLNTRLRDTDDNLEDVCAALGMELRRAEEIMASAGYRFDPAVRQFRAL